MPADPSHTRLLRTLPVTLTILVSMTACAQEPANQVEVGRAVYQQRCATCHGPDRQGTDTGPALVDAIPADIRRAVTEGIDEDPAYQEMVPLPLTNGQLDAVVAFLGESSTAG